MGWHEFTPKHKVRQCLCQGALTASASRSGLSRQPQLVNEDLAAKLSCVLRHELLQFFFGHDLAIEEVNFALCMFGKAWIVGDHADGGTVTMELLQQLHHGLAVS